MNRKILRWITPAFAFVAALSVVSDARAQAVESDEYRVSQQEKLMRVVANGPALSTLFAGTAAIAHGTWSGGPEIKSDTPNLSAGFAAGQNATFTQGDKDKLKLGWNLTELKPGGFGDALKVIRYLQKYGFGIPKGKHLRGFSNPKDSAFEKFGISFDREEGAPDENGEPRYALTVSFDLGQWCLPTSLSKTYQKRILAALDISTKGRWANMLEFGYPIGAAPFPLCWWKVCVKGEIKLKPGVSSTAVTYYVALSAEADAGPVAKCGILCAYVAVYLKFKGELKFFGTRAKVNGVQKYFGGADIEVGICGSMKVEVCVADFEWKICAWERKIRSNRHVISDTPTSEQVGTYPETSCSDGIDNDADGDTDCSDDDCEPRIKLLGNGTNIGGNYYWCPNGCTCQEKCNDGADNDRDGKVDCADSDCAGHGCTETICNNNSELGSNGKPEDADGKVDCADPDCKGKPGPNGQPCP